MRVFTTYHYTFEARRKRRGYLVHVDGYLLGDYRTIAEIQAEVGGFTAATKAHEDYLDTLEEERWEEIW